MVMEDHNCSNYEGTSLRQELMLRILLQNFILIISVVLFAAISVAMVLVPRSVWLLSVAHNTVLLAMALQWCHHGVRTKQIKNYLLLIDQTPTGWERWLPANRPAGILGSRWMVSTKGVFLGLGFANVGLAGLLSCEYPLLLGSGSVALWISSGLFLFTNPKE